MSPRTPRLLTIAGSDSGGGAGIQADLKTFAAHGGYGMSAVTALTAQNTRGVRGIHVAPARFVGAQIDAVLEDLGVDAVKTGMLASAEIVVEVAERLASRGGVPLVVDPVMVAASGAALLTADAVAAIRERLLPLATLLTPNLPEAERLTGRPVGSVGERGEAARALAAAGCAVLLKGGHAEGDEVIDLLCVGGRIHELRHPRIVTPVGHGTGCTLAAAVTARLGRGEPLVTACRGAVDWLLGAIRDAEPLGGGVGPVDPLWLLRREGRMA